MCLLTYGYVLFIVFEKVFLSNYRFNKNFARHLGSPLSKKIFFFGGSLYKELV